MQTEARYWLDKAASAYVTVVGEPILDRYVYVRPLGKSAKENIVTFEPVGTAEFRGGGWIVAEHVRGFATLASYRDVSTRPIAKQRYVEKVFTTKLFSIIESPEVKEDCSAPEESDILLVADYGHGLLREAAVAELSRCRFLALTVQSNSANWGFNLLTKWPRADYVVVDENELRLACHDQHGDIEQLARQQANRMRTTMFAVTLGHEGCLVVNGEKAIRAPAVANRIIDRMGAGDAFLAVTTPLVWAGAPADVVALIGNIAGAIKVGKVGNQPVTRQEVDAWLQTLPG